MPLIPNPITSKFRRDRSQFMRNTGREPTHTMMTPETLRDIENEGTIVNGPFDGGGGLGRIQSIYGMGVVLNDGVPRGEFTFHCNPLNDSIRPSQRITIFLETIRPTLLAEGLDLREDGGRLLYPIYGPSGGLMAAMKAEIISTADSGIEAGIRLCDFEVRLSDSNNQIALNMTASVDQARSSIAQLTGRNHFMESEYTRVWQERNNRLINEEFSVGSFMSGSPARVSSRSIRIPGPLDVYTRGRDTWNSVTNSTTELKATPRGLVEEKLPERVIRIKKDES